MDRRHFLGLSAAVLLAAGCKPSAGTTPATSSGGAAQRATLGLTYIPNVQFSPAYVAVQDKLFGATDVTLRHHGAQEGLFTALVAGQEDVVIAFGDETLQARAQGMDLVAVSTYYASHPARVIARTDAGIASLADLRSKKVGVPGRYGSSWTALLVALATAGLQQSDVSIVEIGYTAQAAMAGKKVDAVVGFSNNDTVQLRRAGLDVTELAVAPQVPLAGACLVTTRKALDARREAIAAVARGVVAGMQAVVADSAKALAATKVYVPGLADATQAEAAAATLAATAPLFKNAAGTVDGKIDVATWQQMADFMRAHALIPAAADVAKAVDTTLV